MPFEQLKRIKRRAILSVNEILRIFARHPFMRRGLCGESDTGRLMRRELCRERVYTKRFMRRELCGRVTRRSLCEEVYDLRRHDLSGWNMRRRILNQKQADFSSFCLSLFLDLSLSVSVSRPLHLAGLQHIHLVRRTMTKVALSRLLFENSVGFSYSELGFQVWIPTVVNAGQRLSSTHNLRCANIFHGENMPGDEHE